MVKTENITTELIMNYILTVITITVIVLFLVLIFGTSKEPYSKTVETYDKQNNTKNGYYSFGILFGITILIFFMIFDKLFATSLIAKYSSTFVKLTALITIFFLFLFSSNYTKTKLEQAFFYLFIVLSFFICLNELTFVKKIYGFFGKVTDNVEKSTDNIVRGSEFFVKTLENLNYDLESTAKNLKKLGYNLNRDLPAILQTIQKNTPDVFKTIIQKIKNTSVTATHTVMGGTRIQVTG
jgi:F0F1-type ATP synthase membrane subunit b/b'